jgi:hypothetical protein
MIKNFKNKQELFNYLLEPFSKKSKVILIRGSTAKNPVTQFSDFDIEVYSKKLRKPYYEIVFLGNKLVLLSVYFYKFIDGDKIKTPEKIKVIHGQYNNSIRPDFSIDSYTNKQKIKRECQLVIDHFFSYLRHKNRLDKLESINKRLK